MASGKNNSVKGEGIPVRYDPLEETFINELNAKTGLSKSEIIRRAMRYAGPKFLSGEVSILTCEKVGLS